MKQFFNTFIIPSIGRPTLKKAIQSIFNQNAKKNETHIVVVFDNCDIVDYGIPNVTNIKTNKKCTSAGEVRNHGLLYIKENIKTKYVSFLDDDDYILNSFNDVVINLNNYELLIHSIKFPFHPPEKRILPDKSGLHIQRARMGIAMSVNYDSLLKSNVMFKSCQAEDYFFALDLINAKLKYWKTGIVTYISPKAGGWK
jgi:glycosyltransferase involved in cell wall biosynthesis